MARPSALAHVDPVPSELGGLAELRRFLASKQGFRVRADDGEELALPSTAFSALSAATAVLELGHAVDVIDSDVDDLSPREVAELLGISRPTVYKLIDEGLLPAEKVPGSATHRRVPREAVERYKLQRDAFKRELSEIGDEARSSGLFTRQRRTRRR